MKILIFGGFVDYQIQLANSLSKTADVMLCISSKKLKKEHIKLINKDVDFYLLGKGKNWYHPINWLALIEFIKTVKKYNPDVIHIQDRSLIFFIIYSYLGRFYPLVFTVHDVLRRNNHVGFVDRINYFFSYRYFNHVMVHGDILKQQMIKNYNCKAEKVYSIPMGEHEVAPFKLYEKPEIEENGNLILFFGKIFEYKGLEYLIKAEPLITKRIPNAKIIIAGNGENFEKYENMMINKNNFIVHNYHIPYEEGADLIQRSSIIVLPYTDASQSGVVPMAYGFKKPVVVTDVGALREIVVNGVTGLIVPPRDPKALAEAIITLLSNRELRESMGENAYKKLKTDLSWDNITPTTMRVYRNAIDEFKMKKRN
jgi:glycosyltransferase involved in cell wall biosynthesis